ncbi:hypothetical protein [Burkholderia pyrrocinia]
MKDERAFRAHHAKPGNSIIYIYMTAIKPLSPSTSGRQMKYAILHSAIKKNGSIRAEFIRDLKRICAVEHGDISTPKSRESTRNRLRKARNKIDAILASNKATRLDKLKNVFRISNNATKLHDLKKLNLRLLELLASLHEDRFQALPTLNSAPDHYASELNNIRKNLEELARQVVNENISFLQRDDAYIQQAYESTLCAVFSEAKDRFMENPRNNIEYARNQYAKDIGDAAKSLGLPGTEKKQIFTPSGAGMNPFFLLFQSRAFNFMGAAFARPEYRAARSHIRQFMVDAIKDKLPPDKAASIDRFKKMVTDLDRKWLHASEELIEERPWDNARHVRVRSASNTEL